MAAGPPPCSIRQTGSDCPSHNAGIDASRVRIFSDAVFLVEQNVRQTLAIAHYGYVLSQGCLVAQGSAQELDHNEQVRAAHFG